jgi:large subunit ribosomal protein L4
MELKFFKSDGSSGGVREVDLPTREGNGGMVALRNVLVAYQNNFRQGDAQAKTRAEVSGSGKKPYRQKGTGMARHGERRSPIWSGGGVTFGPRRRDYSVKINKKLRRVALGRSFAMRAEEGSLTLVDRFSLERPKTKEFMCVLEKIVSTGADMVLLVDREFEQNVIMAARNIPHVHMVEARTLTAWEMCCCKKIVISESAMEVVLARIAA